MGFLGLLLSLFLALFAGFPGVDIPIAQAAALIKYSLGIAALGGSFAVAGTAIYFHLRIERGVSGFLRSYRLEFPRNAARTTDSVILRLEGLMNNKLRQPFAGIMFTLAVTFSFAFLPGLEDFLEIPTTVAQQEYFRLILAVWFFASVSGSSGATTVYFGRYENRISMRVLDALKDEHPVQSH